MVLILLSLSVMSQPPVITEVAANPLVETTGEFVEIFNPSSSPVCLSGYSLTDGDALDDLIPWDENAHGAFPHAGVQLETDTIPPEGFALVFELDYAGDPAYSIEPGTVILTTGDRSICNGLAASSDPLTLFSGEGTADSCAVSTYGTPYISDQWQERDDDGLDGIPFDPGDGYTVERYPWSSPDQDGSWLTGPEGGTPGAHGAAPPDTLNIACEGVWTVPAEPLPGEPFQLFAGFSCWGTAAPETGTLTLFLEAQGDSSPAPDEVIAVFDPTSLTPGMSDTFSVTTPLPQGWFLPSALADVEGDGYPPDDYSSSPIRVGEGVDPVLLEVMSNPLEEDFGEYLELFYPGPGIFPLSECAFTDGDALDQITCWSGDQLSDPDAVYSSLLPAGSFAVILDPEYTMGTEPYELPAGTVVMTVENTTLGNGLTTTDPLTLYGPFGTAQEDVLSTYGTPLESDDPLSCDDDGLDGIPFDPGDGRSVERRSPDLPDSEYSWETSPPGGTPGAPGVYPDSADAALLYLLVEPLSPEPGEAVTLTAEFFNCGTLGLQDIDLCVFLDSDADSTVDPGEPLTTITCPSLAPGEADTCMHTFSCPEEGSYLAAALVSAEGDQNPSNDLAMTPFTSGEGVAPVITEVLCNPEAEDNDEFVEVHYPGPGVLHITGCSLTDGDALDIIVPWDPSLGEFSDPDIFTSPWLPAGSYAVILDSEYASGDQPYQFPPGTVALTTGNTTLGDGLTSTDPVTLYTASGTAAADVASTYGTPVDSDDPLHRDDDGLDGIPLDPGEGNSVQRLALSSPDSEECWAVSQDGPTPGGPPPEIYTGANSTALDLQSTPPMGPEGCSVALNAVFAGTGTDSIPSDGLLVRFYADLDANGEFGQEELLGSITAGPLAPGDTIETSMGWSGSAGPMTLLSTGSCALDSIPDDDSASCVWNPPPGIVINEVMYEPEPGLPEWVELTASQGVSVQLQGWSFEDSRESTVFCGDSLVLADSGFVILTSDSSAFRQAWPGVACPVLQPPEWPVLNNSTQQGEEWADRLILRNETGDAVDLVPYNDDWGGSRGVSLERMGPLFPGWSSGSWTGCTTGGTPGAVNSCAHQGSTGRFLEYSPDPFSPDGDGTDDFLSISVSAGWESCELTLTVYNVQGRVVRELASDDPCTGTAELVWDGTTDEGERLPVGRYIIYLGVRESDSGELRETCGVVVLARRL